MLQLWLSLAFLKCGDRPRSGLVEIERASSGDFPIHAQRNPADDGDTVRRRVITPFVERSARYTIRLVSTPRLSADEPASDLHNESDMRHFRKNVLERSVWRITAA